MSEDTPKMYSTLPPPGDAEDLYSASTVVGQASAELLALVREATEEADTKPNIVRPAVPPPSAEEGSAGASAPPAPKKSAAPAIVPLAKRAAEPAPDVIARPHHSEPPLEPTSRRPAAKTDPPRPERGRSAMPPALAIALVFAAAAFVLAALVR